MLKRNVFMKMLLPDCGSTSAAMKNKQAANVCVGQDKRTLRIIAPILGAGSTVTAGNRRAIGIFEIPKLHELFKTFQRASRLLKLLRFYIRRQNGAHLGFHLFPEGPGNDHRRNIALDIGDVLKLRWWDMATLTCSP